MNIILKTSWLLHMAGGLSNRMPFTSTVPSRLSNANKYKAILLGMLNFSIHATRNVDRDFLDDEPDTFEGWRSYAAHFLVRTSSTPLGPNLNPTSSVGITDQTLPLVGYDILTVDGSTGYWPLFATTKANLAVDLSSSYWIPAYGSSGAQASVSCSDDEVIVGVRYKSHLQAQSLGEGGANGSPLTQIPDIQCAKLQPTTMVDAVDYNSVNNVTVTVQNGSDVATVRTDKSVIDLKQCMVSKTTSMSVKRQTSTLNTCYGQQVSVSSSPVLLIEYLLSLKPEKFDTLKSSSHHHRGHSSSPEILEFLIDTDPYSVDSLFGSIGTDNQTQDLLKSLQLSRDQAEAKASAEYEANFNQPAPTVDEINQELGPTPWDSSQLISNSPEFVAGSLISGGKVSIVRGFSAGSDQFVTLICGGVVGCAHGTCANDTCKCNPGFGGDACMDQLDPCLNRPCGNYGICKADFTSTNATSSGKFYTCKCNNGWSGDNCEVTSDLCAVPDPNIPGMYIGADCGHGVCVPGNISNTSAPKYTCGCNIGWGHADSTNSSSACTSAQNDCQGVWTKGVCDSTCSLIETYAVMVQASGNGTVCRNAEGDQRTSACTGGACKSCVSRDCNGRGSCDDSSGNCVCQAGWTGNNCELSTDQCSQKVCNGRGNCKDDNVTCTCMNGWLNSGSAQCAIDPCIGCPSGKCNSESGYCSCTEGVDDFREYPACQRALALDCVGQWGSWGQCSSTCVQTRYFSIVTPAGPGGAMCPNKVGDTQTQACTSGTCCKLDGSKCLNGATFVADSCSCVCPIGFQGTYCETQSVTAMREVHIEQTVAVSSLGALGTTARPTVDVPIVSAADAPTEAPANNNMMIYIGAGVGGLLLIGAAAYFLTKKPTPQTDPLLAGVEGLEGMDLTGMDLSALNLDPNAAPPTNVM